MKALVITDVEGVIGVYDMSDETGFSRLITRETKLLTEVLKNKGIEDILVCDSHNSGGWIDASIFPDGVRIIPNLDLIDFTEVFDFAILSGYHGMNHSGGVLEHTIHPSIDYMTLDGRYVGEVGLLVDWLGSNNVPVIFVSGDEAATKEGTNSGVPHICAIKSVLDNPQDVDLQLRYSKFKDSLSIAIDEFLSGNLKCTLKASNGLVSIRFVNPDVLDYLSEEFQIADGLLIIDDSVEFYKIVNHLIARVNESLEKIIRQNLSFLKDIKGKFRQIGRDNVHDPRLKYILSKYILFINQEEREYVLNCLKAM